MSSNAARASRGAWNSGLSIALSVAALLSACGGGGGGDGGADLNVTFSYSVTSLYGYEVWAPWNLEATLYGLDGKTPNCSLTGGRLPSGMSIHPTTCALTGTPTEVGDFDFTATLRVSGYSGSVSTSNTLRIDAPYLLYRGQPIEAGLSWGSPSTSVPTLMWGGGIHGNHQDTSRDTLGNFRLSSGDHLPLGLSLDPTTGIVSGTLVGFGSWGYQILADVTRDGRLVTAVTERSHGGPVYDTEVVYDTVPAPAGRIGQAYQLPAPVFAKNRTLIGAEYEREFRVTPVSVPGRGACAGMTMATLPAGLRLDPQTGAVSGTPTEVSAGCISISVSIIDSNRVGIQSSVRAPISITP